VLHGRTGDYKIKGTPGITAQFVVREAIELQDYDLDVGLSCPGIEGDSKGPAVRRLKRHMS